MHEARRGGREDKRDARGSEKRHACSCQKAHKNKTRTHIHTLIHTHTQKYSYTLHTKISNSKLLMSQTKKAMMTTRQQKEEGQKVGQGEGQHSRELVKYQVGAQAAELRLQ